MSFCHDCKLNTEDECFELYDDLRERGDTRYSLFKTLYNYMSIDIEELKEEIRELKERNARISSIKGPRP